MPMELAGDPCGLRRRRNRPCRYGAAALGPPPLFCFKHDPAKCAGAQNLKSAVPLLPPGDDLSDPAAL